MINAIFAVDYYGGMGFNGSLPWPHNSEDLQNFKTMTNNQVVVMGSRTWNDPAMPKPLKGRIVYVASSKPVKHGMQIQGNIKEEVLKLEKKYPDQEIFVIGGPKIIEECLPIIDKIYLTHMKGSYKIDTKIDLKALLIGWKPVKASVAKNYSFTLVEYENLFKRTQNSTR